MRRRYSVDVGVVETAKRNAEGRLQRVQLEVDFVGGYHIPHYNENGVLIMGLFDFLLDADGLEIG